MILSNTFNLFAIHVLNPNDKSNTPNAYWNGFHITEYLDPSTMVAVEGFIFKSLIDSGLGDDTLNLNRLVIDSMINGNAAGEVSEEEKASVLDVLDRFMARWNTPNKVEAVEA